MLFAFHNNNHKSNKSYKRRNCQQMSSYFVNSFCGRYPNGADYQLHNYGDHSSANEQYRDSASMHSSRYGYGYNGMDLTVGRGAGGHFVGSERTAGYSPSHSAATSASVEPVRYSHSQSTSSAGNSSLSPPPDPLPCSSVASSSPVAEAQSQHRPVKNSSAAQCSSSNGGALLLSRDCVSKASPLEDEKAAGSAPSTPQNASDSAQPQIYPWMRKLHISHGKRFHWITSWFLLNSRSLLSHLGSVASYSKAKWNIFAWHDGLQIQNYGFHVKSKWRQNAPSHLFDSLDSLLSKYETIYIYTMQR